MLTKTSPDYVNTTDNLKVQAVGYSNSKSETVILANEQEVKPVYYTIPVAAEKAGVNTSTLHKAADNDKLPYQLVNPGTKLEFKVVTVEDVIEWNSRRDPMRKGGRPKKSGK